MKIYSKKKLWEGIAFIAAVLYFLWKGQGRYDIFTPFDWLTFALMFALGCSSIYTAFRKKTGRRVMIEENDEREKLLELKIYRISFWVCLFGLLLAGWFVRTHAGDDKVIYLGEGMQISALLLLLLHTIVDAVYVTIHMEPPQE